MADVVNFQAIARRLVKPEGYDALDGHRLTESLVRDASLLAAEFLRQEDERYQEMFSDQNKTNFQNERDINDPTG